MCAVDDPFHPTINSLVPFGPGLSWTAEIFASGTSKFFSAPAKRNLSLVTISHPTSLTSGASQETWLEGVPLPRLVPTRTLLFNRTETFTDSQLEGVETVSFVVPQ